MSEDTKISPIKRAALLLVDKLRDMIMTDCSDEEIATSLVKFNPETYGYVKEDDFVNYDEALKMLHLSNNRAKLNDLCKFYKIKNIRFNNMPIGFPKKDIEMLARKIQEEYEKKKAKRKGFFNKL